MYIYKNFNEKIHIAQIPRSADTLYLYKNNTFKSSYYGKGVYNIHHTFKGTRIRLNYDDGSYDFAIKRYYIFGILIIDVHKDLNIYYEQSQ